MKALNERLQRVSLRDQLSHQLEQMILSQEIPAGATLPSERELVDKWGVSRAIVRDAIRILESKGLVEVRQGLGTVVKGDVREAFAMALELLVERGQYPLSDLMRLRILLEAETACLAAHHATEADLNAMDAILNEYAVAASAGNVRRVIEADRAFHLRLLASIPNALLVDLVGPIIGCFMARTLFLDPASGLDLEDNLRHRGIYDCIKAGDGAGAAQALRQTLSSSLATLDRLEAESRVPYYPHQEAVELCCEEA